MKLELNKVYYREIENLAVGDIPKEQLIEIFKDGRVSCHFLQPQLNIWFPETKFVDANGYDHEWLNEDAITRLIEQKGYNQSGANYRPSSQLGIGRTPNDQEIIDFIDENSLVYVITDNYDFPKIRIRFIEGKELLQLYPNFKISVAERENFFGEHPRSILH